MHALCRQCSMTVSPATLTCPRCRERFPGAYALRRPAIELLGFLALFATTGAAWLLAFRR